MDCSFGLLKPDCFKRDLEEEVLNEITAAGLEIAAAKRVRLTKEEVDVIWASCLSEDFYDKLIEFSVSGDCLAFIVRGNDAIARLGNLIGHYDPDKAEEETIRRRFGTSMMENIIHSANDREEFLRESLLFFSQEELNQLIQGKK